MPLPICLFPPGTPFSVPGTRMCGRVLDGCYEAGFMKVRMVNGDGRVRELTISPGTEVVADETAGTAVDQAGTEEKAETRRRLRDLHERAAVELNVRRRKPSAVNQAIEAGRKVEAKKIRKHQSPVKKSASRPTETRTPRPCTCGCGAQTSGSRFLPGHDSKLKSVLRAAVRAGTVSPAQKRLIAELDWGRFVC